ncbi:hypothetical protein L596_021776 [Steinernema carpocapsae]|uniref:Peptidase S1 domain-containing protein n=1 Tax=Steinernema carpocapsae TaxID=34508 RepID=A0A4U5MJS2_STECR|nr:hypothetical protein L596_021776 [Steinernema carpocapsae]
MRLLILLGFMVICSAQAHFPYEATCGPVENDWMSSSSDSIDRCQYTYLVHIEADVNHNGHPEKIECTGILLETGHVLTSAHCFDKQPDISHYTLFFGLFDKEDKTDENVQIRKAVDNTIYPDYEQGQEESDVALIQVEADVDFTAAVQPAMIFRDDRFLWEHTKAHVVGYGIKNDFLIKKLKICV